MTVFELMARIGLDRTEFERGLGESEKSLRRVEERFGRAGRTLTSAVTLPLAAIGAGALKMGGDFEAAMNQVQALTSATEDEFRQLRDLAKELGATTQFSTSEAAEAMSFLAMAGMETSQILGAMPDVLLLAASAGLDMASSADIVTNIMAGYGMEVSELSGAVDVLVQAFTSANTNLPQLAEAMKYAGPVANAAGVEFTEAAAALALMGNAGIQASMAGTSLRGAVTRMLNPTEKVSNIMKAAGLSFTDAEGRLLSLDEIIRQLEPHADDAGLFMEIFGQRAGPAMAALVSQGADALVDLTAALDNSAGRAQEVADVQMRGLVGAYRLFTSAVEAVLIAIADSGLLEAVTALLRQVAEWIQGLSELNPLILRWATILGGLLATIGPVLWAVGSFAGALANLAPLLKGLPALLTGIRTAFGLLTGPIGLVVLGITALVTAFATDFLGIRTYLTEVWEHYEPTLTRMWEHAERILRWLGEAFVSAWEGIKKAFTAGVRHVSEVMAGVRDTLDAAIRVVSALFRGDFAAAWDAARDVITAWWDTVNAFFLGLPAQMLEAGKNVVTGLVDGIKSQLAAARDAVTGFGSNVAGWFRDALGIRSPSRVFYEFGRNIVEGLADGIRELQSEGEAAVAELAALITRRALEALGLNVRPNQWEEMGAAVAQGIIDGFDAVIPGFADRLAAAAAAAKAAAGELALARHIATGGPLRVPEPTLGGITPAGPFVPDPIGIEGRRARPSVDLAPVWAFVETLVGGVEHGVEVAREATLAFLADVEAYGRELRRREREAARERRMANQRAREAAELRYGTYGDQYTVHALNDPRSPARPAPPALIVPGLREPGAELPELAPIVPDLLPPPAEPELIARPSTERAEAEREAAIRAEIEARRASVDALMTMSTEKGALGNFGASLLALAVDKVPLLGSAIDGFVQGGPMGALVAVLTDLLSRSEAFTALIEHLSGFVQRLADVLGTLLDALWPIIEVALQLVEVALAPLVWLLTNVVAPVFRFVARIVAGIWNAIATAINWALGWLGVRLPTIDPDGGVPRSGDAPASGSRSGSDAPGARSGGRQVSEITGPTRDLLVSLLTPLSALPSMTGYLASIRDILDARLMPASALAGAGAGGVVFHPGAIVIQTSAVDAEGLLDDLEAGLARRLGNRWRSY